MAAKPRSLQLELVAKPHNGRVRTYTDPETGISVNCQIELRRLPKGQTPTYDGKQLDIPEDFGWYWDHEAGVWVERIGGQRLLLKMAMTYKRFVAPVGRRFGKCLTEDARIDLADGSRPTIGSLVGSTFRVRSLVNGKLIDQAAGAEIDKVKQCVEITLSSGRTLTASDDHPLRKFKGWVKAGELVPGDRVAVARHGVFGAERLPFSDAALLALAIGDGGVANRSFRFSTACPVILRRLARLAPIYGCTVRHVANYDYSITKNGGLRNGAITLLRDHGVFGRRSFEKSVPDAIFRSNERTVRTFLRHLYATDGWATHREIGLASSSWELARGVQSLLLKYGIHANLCAKKTACRPAWTVLISRHADKIDFARRIGIFSKEDAVRRCVEGSPGHGHGKSHIDTLPADVWGEIESEIGDRSARSVFGDGIRVRKHWAPSRDKVRRMSHALESRRLARHLAAEVVWDKVVSVVRVGKRQTYSISILDDVPYDDQNFLAEGIVTHNTTSVFFLLLAEGARTAGKYYALVVSPSHDKAYELMEHIVEMWGGPPGQKDENGRPKPTVVTKIVGGPRDQRRYIETHSLGDPSLPDVNKGCRIYFVSGGHPHYKRIRGYPHPMHRIIVDEFAQAHPDLWPVINPMLADAGGRGLFIGTTDEKDIGNDLFHTFFLWGLDTSPKRKNWGCMNFPSFSNPHLNEEGLEEVEDGCVTEDDRLQEIYAKFLTGRGAVFQNLAAIMQLPFITGDELPQWVREIEAEGISTLGKAQNTAMRPPQVWLHADPKPDHTYVMAADWAKDRDHTVMTVVDLTTMKQVILVRFYGQNWPEQYLWAYRLYQRYHCSEFHGDENTGAGQAIGDFMRTEYATGIYPHKFNVQNKAAYVHRGQTIFLRRQVKLINCYEQYEEIKSFKVFSPDTTKGQVLIRYGHPPGRNDDFVDAFLMLTETIKRGKVAVSETPEEIPQISVTKGVMTLHTAALGLDDKPDLSGML